jgi:3,4-dihydroxy 2-butanone 4-phosphate synthase/GTP cyclohydrolase II
MADFSLWLENAASRRANPMRPLVTLTFAQSLDGCITAQAGERTGLSGPESSHMTLELRSIHDAILVGVGTVLADDPLLTARLPGKNDPQPVILDSWLRTPPTVRLLTVNPHSAWIACQEPSDPVRRRALETNGARLLHLPADPARRISLTALLDCLGGMDIRRLMVEGWASVITSFLAQGLADLLVITIAPVLLGGLRSVETDLQLTPGRPSFPRLVQVEYEQYGEDLVVVGLLH